MPSQAKQVRVQLANIQPGLTTHWNEIDSHVVVLYLSSHTGHTIAYTVHTPETAWFTAVPTDSSTRTSARRYITPLWETSVKAVGTRKLILWNHLPSSVRQPHSSPSVSDLPVLAPMSATTFSHSVNSPLSSYISPRLFHSRLKTYLFHESFPP